MTELLTRRAWSGKLSFNGQRAGIGVPDADSLKITDSLSISAWVLITSYTTSADAGFILFRGDGRGALDPYALVTKPDGTVQFHLESLTKLVTWTRRCPKDGSSTSPRLSTQASASCGSTSTEF